MTIIIPKHYHAKSALEANNITCIPEEIAVKQDVRPLRIGILNIMPDIETYEFNLLYPLGKSILQIDPVWIKLRTLEYGKAAHEHLDSLYVTFDEAVRDKRLDGLIITGSSPREFDFEEVKYWQEVRGIMQYARKNIISTLGICWGGMALTKELGIDKDNLKEKLFGVFKTRNLDQHHPITGDLDDFFMCPQSRRSGYSNENLEKERDKGKIKLLAVSDHAGYTIFESTDQRFLIHLGHPEYNSGRLVEEHHQDPSGAPDDSKVIENFCLEKPLNSWRSHRNEFFGQWIKNIYMETSYDWPRR